MSVLDLQDALRRKVEKHLQKVLFLIERGEALYYFLGNGKDGEVYAMWNPDDSADRSLDRFAVKIWYKAFRYRQQEVDFQRLASETKSEHVRVPKILLVNFELGCFVMERIRAQTMFRTVLRPRKYISEEMLDQIEFSFSQLAHLDIIHNDAHTLNYLIENPVFTGNVLTDGTVWIIDFGRSVSGSSTKDTNQVREDLGRRIKLVEEPILST